MVESPDGVVSLRVSPNVLPASLTENPDVRIDPVPVGTEPTDAVASHGAYEISSSPVITLRKAATLTFNVPQGVSPDRLAVYQLSGTAWSRIGGTAEGDQIRVPVTDLTIYGLFEVSSTTGGTGAVSNIDFSNRAFSPSGRRGGGQPLRAGGGQAAPVLLRTTDISFDLSAPANVRIEIYNRSGRLQTLLTAGQQMNAGRNVVTWDGTNGDGEQVRSGLYIVSIEAGGEGEQKTVAVVNR